MSTTPFESRSRVTGTEEAVAIEAVRATCLHRLVEVDVAEMIAHILVSMKTIARRLFPGQTEKLILISHTMDTFSKEIIETTIHMLLALESSRYMPDTC